MRILRLSRYSIRYTIISEKSRRVEGICLILGISARLITPVYTTPNVFFDRITPAWGVYRAQANPNQHMESPRCALQN